MWRLRWFLPCLTLVAPFFVLAQNAAVLPEAIKDPKAMLDAAESSYDFDNPALKPWYLKTTYEFYSVDGVRPEEGTYERWWISPKEYRNTWTRGDNVHSEWHTSDGTIHQLDAGQALHLVEADLPELLLSPLPKTGEYDPAKDWLERDTVDIGKVRLPCVRVVSKEVPSAQRPSDPNNIVANDCFDPKFPVVILRTNADGVAAIFSQYVQVQGRDLPRSLVETVDGRKLLAVTLHSVASIDAEDPALIPPPNATTVNDRPIEVGARVMNGKRTKGPMPEYPDQAKFDRLMGTVILEARIGTDGKIHDLQAISSPGSLLTKAAEKAVSRWEYQPYLFNGEPVEVRTTIKVIYKLGR